jgi:hypothetical protein
MIEPVYVPYEQYRAAKMRCGLDSRIYGTFMTTGILANTATCITRILDVHSCVYFSNVIRYIKSNYFHLPMSFMHKVLAHYCMNT